MVHYKLTYFPLRAAAEISRQIFVVAGQKFEDVRIPRNQWDGIKSSTPFGKVPILHVDGKVLAQSHAIARYLAREFSLNGKTAWEEAQVNAIADQYKDYQADIRPWFVIKAGLVEGNIEEQRENTFLPAFKRHFGYFSNILNQSKSGYFVGDSLTWVDLLIAQHISDLINDNSNHEFLLPGLKEHQQLVHSNEKLKEWIATRPESHV